MLIEAGRLSKESKGLSHNNLGVVYREKNEYELAAYHLKQGEIQFKAENNLKGLTLVYNSWGDLFFKQQKYGEAIYMYHESILKDHVNIELASIYSLPSSAPDIFTTDIRYYLRSVGSKALSLYELSKIHTDRTEFLRKKSLETYLYALDIVDTWQRRSTNRSFQLFLKDEVYKIYEGAIQVATELGNLELALEFAAQSKSSLLLSSVNQLDPKEFKGLPRHLIQNERQIRQQITKFENVLALNPEDNDARDHLIQYREELDIYIHQLKSSSYQDYYSLRFRLNDWNLEELQSKMTDNSSIVQYFVGEETSFAFHITKDNLEVKPFENKDSLILEIVSLIQTTYSKPPMDFMKPFQQMATDLYASLLGGFSQEVGDTLVIIPDGKLAYLPFEALTKSQVQLNDPNQNLDYLIFHHVISYANSISEVFSENSDAKFSSKDTMVLAFAPTFEIVSQKEIPKEDKNYLTHQLFNQVVANSTLNQSKSSDIGNNGEIELISEIVKVKGFAEKRALLGRFFVEAPKYAIFHLATHGIVSDEHPDLNYLQFTPIADSLNNEHLLMGMLYGISIDAALVVLSACQTLIGKANRGEGLSSISYAFSYAGAKSTLATLWNVRAKEKVKIMTNFYTHLSAGEKKSVAIRQAKLEYIETNFNHPYFWSGFLLTGQVDPIFPKKNPAYLMWLILGVILLGTLGILIVNLLRKN